VSARGASARAQAHAHGHVRAPGKARPTNTAHERQAEAAGAAFARGATGLSAQLTPAPAAHLRLAGSVARSLPAALRGQLEHAFVADLRALRVFDDAPAQAAARALGAHAFAAGADLYFAAGAWRPDCSAGRARIAHEVAHALQQSGRAASGGRLRLEQGAEGNAGVQRDPVSNVVGDAIERLLPPPSRPEDRQQVVERHVLTPADRVPAALASQLKAALDGHEVAAMTAQVDAILASNPADKRSAGETALFFDVYKALGAHDKAIALVGEKLPASTAFGSWPFYLERRQKDAAWIVDTLNGLPAITRFFPNAIVRAMRQDFLSGLDQPTPLAAGGLFETTLGHVIDVARDYRPQMPEERVLAALIALREFDKGRRKHYLARHLRTSNELLVDRILDRRNVVALYTSPQRLVKDAEKDRAGPEVGRIAAEVGRLLVPTAQRALQFWDAANKLRNDLMPDPKKVREFLQKEKMQGEVKSRLASIKGLRGLDASVANLVNQALALQAGKVPGQDDQKADRTKAADSSAALVAELERRVAQDNASHFGDPSGPSKDIPGPDGTLGNEVVQSAIILLLAVLHDFLVSETAVRDGSKDDAATPMADKALADYKWLANVLGAFSELIGLDAAAASARTSQHARQPGLSQSRIGLLAPFALQPTSLSDYAKAFPAGAFYKDGTLTHHEVVEWAYVMFHEDLVGELDKALREVTPRGITREFDDTNTEPVINSATKAVWSHGHQPRRYRVPVGATIFHVREADADHVAPLVADTHPALVELLRHGRVNEFIITPEGIRQHAEGFTVWMVPDMAPLARELAAIPGVVDVIAADGKPVGPVSAAASATQWLLRLNAATKLDAKARAAIGEAIHARETKAAKALEGLYRRATNNERRKVGRLIAEQWNDLPATFLDDTEKYESAPRLALQFMHQFLLNVRPDTREEQRLQMTALMLELAPVMSRRLTGKDRYDILLPLHGDLVGAAAAAMTPSYAAQRDWLLTGLDAAATAARAKQLTDLATDFRETVEKRQARTELDADPAANELSVAGSHRTVQAKPPEGQDAEDESTFIANGVVYTILRVHRSFRFQPQTGNKFSPAFNWGQTNPLGSARLWVDGQERFRGDSVVSLLTITRFHNNTEQTFDITSERLDDLSELTYAVYQHFNSQDLEALGDVLEAGAHALLSAMQILFPEFASEIAMAEIGTSIIQFFGTPEYRLLEGALNDDSQGILGKGLSSLTDGLEPSLLWDWFLFDKPLPPVFRLLEAAAGAAGRFKAGVGQKGDDKTKGAVHKVFDRIFNVGKVVLHDVQKVHSAVNFPVRRFSLFVQGSPLLQAMLRLAAHELQKMENLDLDSMARQGGEDLTQNLHDTYGRFLEIVEGLSAFELPNELIPLHDIIEMVVNLVIDHLPAKYSYPIRTSRKIDAVESLFQWIFNKVADLLIEHGLDPNRIWRSFAGDFVNPLLQKAGGAVADAAKDLLDEVPQLKKLHATDTMKPKDIALKFVADDADARQTAAPKAGATGPTAGGGTGLPLGRGRGLDAARLARAQRGFGHDFRHVRLHEGTDVDRALRSAGALAATSGSHVYIDSTQRHHPDLMHHELAHVLQQAGARPLGARHSASPVHASSQAGGWRVDADAEARADELAAQAREPADAPRAVRRHDGVGVQPKSLLKEVVATFFSKTGDPALLQARADVLAKTVIDKDALEQAAPHLRTTLLAQLKTSLRPDKPAPEVSFAHPFKSEATTILHYIDDNHRRKLEEAMPHLIMGALDQITYDKGKGKTAKSFWYLNPSKMEVQLGQYFFGIAGLSVAFKFKRARPRGPDGKQRATIAEENSFEKIEFDYVHLASIGSGADLWNHILHNTFDPLAGDEFTKTKSAALRAIANEPPGPGIFASKGSGKSAKLVFGLRAKEAIKKALVTAPKTKLDPDLIPPWRDYIDPDKKTEPQSGKEFHGQLGLRMGFYRQKGDLDGQRGTDRESHHTVQYLLMEYLSNSLGQEQRPFPAPLDHYPNVTGKSGDVTIARDPGGSSGIHAVAGSARGPDMPTLLLARVTHQSGVHVTPSADEEGGGASQGKTVHKDFSDALGDYRDLVLDKAHRPKLQALTGAGGTKKSTPGSVVFDGRTVTARQLSAAIHDAANKTYNLMRNDMNQKLLTRLDKHEHLYYNEVVSRATDKKIFANGHATPAYTPTDVADKVLKEVRKRQREAFDSPTFGFRTQ